MSVSKIKATVFSQEQLASDVFSMWLEVGSIASEAKPGQFISVYSNDDSKLLPRPISICEIDRENGRLRIVYRVVGYGTKEFSGCKAGDILEIMGPLGNGYTLKKNKAILVAGGIGACLACVCKSKDVDHHTNVHNKRICKDGPVFNAQEVEL